MSDPSPSASPLVRQAARNLHRRELLAENPAWTDWGYRWNFWRFRQILVQTPDGAAAWLPEAHPQTGPTGITGQTTGRTAGSDPPARHPFPEVIRHE